MTLEEIHELGRAAVSLKQVADALTDDKLKDKVMIQAGLVMDAHDELLQVHIMRQNLDAAAALATKEWKERNC